MVYKALEDLVGSEIHAITLELLTPAEREGRVS
jgi:stress-induced morphogen